MYEYYVQGSMCVVAHKVPPLHIRAPVRDFVKLVFDLDTWQLFCYCHATISKVVVVYSTRRAAGNCLSHQFLVSFYVFE